VLIFVLPHSTCKYQTSLEKLATDKYSGLICQVISDEKKCFATLTVVVDGTELFFFVIDGT
jgi:hypothetical protein